jgi:hypothetical protein
VVNVPRAPNIFGAFSSTTHAGPWNYVQRVPLVLYGPHQIPARGTVNAGPDTTVADLSPTLAKVLHTPFPATTGHALPVGAGGDSLPRVVVVVVWDGGGWDVLKTWPHAWPHLRKMMQRGISFAGTTVSSSPSVTPAIHTTIGTGTYPRQHGVVDMSVRRHGHIFPAYPKLSPRGLARPTLADVYDPTTQNRAKVGMLAYRAIHLGMVGHGAAWPHGDHDIAAIANTRPGRLKTNPTYYSIPGYIQKVPGFNRDIELVDRSDGSADMKWMGHDLRATHVQRHSPVWVRYESRLLRTLLARQHFGGDKVPDLFYVNFKQVDDAGHEWNMLHKEVRNVVQAADTALGQLVRWLNHSVGKGRYVVAMTADHGQSPEPDAVGAWPIMMGHLVEDVAQHFGFGDPKQLFDAYRPGAMWLNKPALSSHDITPTDVANYLLDYTIDDNADGSVPQEYADLAQEPVFSAAFPGPLLNNVWSTCNTTPPKG